MPTLTGSAALVLPDSAGAAVPAEGAQALRASPVAITAAIRNFFVSFTGCLSLKLPRKLGRRSEQELTGKCAEPER